MLLWATRSRIGLNRYLMENRQSRSHLGTIFTTFCHPYLNLVRVQIVTDLKILLGSFLFLVPGIIWQYQYALGPPICWRKIPTCPPAGPGN